MIVNESKKRFELKIDDHVAFASYDINGVKLLIKHVEAAPELRGTGAANKLMQEILAYSKENHLDIHPICSYAVHWINRNKSE